MSLVPPIGCPDNDFVGDIVQALEQSFGVTFDVWGMASESADATWTCLSTSSPAMNADSQCKNETTAAELFNTALACFPRPTVHQLDECKYLVCVPFQKPDRSRMLAVTILNVPRAEAVQKLAEMWVNTIQNLAEERELTAQFGFEMSVCMEATELLQSIAYGIRKCTTIGSSSQLINTALTNLRTAINAESILFLPDMSASIRQQSAMVTDGTRLVTEAQGRMLLEFSDLQSRQPVVHNHNTEQLQQLGIQGVRSFLVVEVFPPERIGWLIALNKEAQLPWGVTAADPNHYEFGTAEAGLMTAAGSLLAVTMNQYPYVGPDFECGKHSAAAATLSDLRTSLARLSHEVSDIDDQDIDHSLLNQVESLRTQLRELSAGSRRQSSASLSE